MSHLHYCRCIFCQVAEGFTLIQHRFNFFERKIICIICINLTLGKEKLLIICVCGTDCVQIIGKGIGKLLYRSFPVLCFQDFGERDLLAQTTPEQHRHRCKGPGKKLIPIRTIKYLHSYRLNMRFKSSCKNKPDSPHRRQGKDYIPFLIGGYLGAGTVYSRLKVLHCKKIYCSLQNTVELAAAGKLKQSAVM